MKYDPAIPLVIGETYGWITVLATIPHSKGLWIDCRCKCGHVFRSTLSWVFSVQGQKRNSCRQEKCPYLRKHAKTHGLSGTQPYEAWQQMIFRCEKPHHKSFNTKRAVCKQKE